MGLLATARTAVEAVLRTLARSVDATEINPAFPTYFPRLVQKAVWALASQSAMDLCNAARVKRGRRCAVAGVCPVRAECVFGRP